VAVPPAHNSSVPRLVNKFILSVRSHDCSALHSHSNGHGSFLMDSIDFIDATTSSNNFY